MTSNGLQLKFHYSNNIPLKSQWPQWNSSEVTGIPVRSLGFQPNQRDSSGNSTIAITFQWNPNDLSGIPVRSVGFQWDHWDFSQINGIQVEFCWSSKNPVKFQSQSSEVYGIPLDPSGISISRWITLGSHWNPTWVFTGVIFISCVVSGYKCEGIILI
jgi:hypothetical protein